MGRPRPVDIRIGTNFALECVIRCALLLCLITTSLGCPHSRFARKAEPFGPRTAHVLPPSAGKDDIVAHLNRNIIGSQGSSGLDSWQCHSLKIDVKGAPVSVKGSIAVEAPRSLRLRVSDPVMRDLVDLGSNSDRFWFWAKDSEPPVVYTSRHADIELAQRQLQIPFHPDWLMEVLGVIPLDPTEYTMETPGDGTHEVRLVSTRALPSGQSVRRVIVVHRGHGIILAHRLEDSGGQLIAKASLSQHQRDPATQIIMPQQYRLEWPQNGLDLKMHLSNVLINPPQMSQQAWMVPTKSGYPQFDVSRYVQNAPVSPPKAVGFPQQEPAVAPTSSVNLEPAPDWTPLQPPARALKSTMHADEPAPEAEDEPTDARAEFVRPSAYSPAASRSSSGRPRRGQESLPLPFPAGL